MNPTKEELKQCRFCGSGETRFEESTYWTGMRSIVLKVTLRHWCEHTNTLPRMVVTVEAKTKEECIELWNTRATDPLLNRMAEALESILYGVENCDRVENYRIELAAEALQAYRDREKTDADE